MSICEKTTCSLGREKRKKEKKVVPAWPIKEGNGKGLLCGCKYESPLKDLFNTRMKPKRAKSILF